MKKESVADAMKRGLTQRESEAIAWLDSKTSGRTDTLNLINELRAGQHKATKKENNSSFRLLRMILYRFDEFSTGTCKKCTADALCPKHSAVSGGKYGDYDNPVHGMLSNANSILCEKAFNGRFDTTMLVTEITCKQCEFKVRQLEATIAKQYGLLNVTLKTLI